MDYLWKSWRLTATALNLVSGSVCRMKNALQRCHHCISALVCSLGQRWLCMSCLPVSHLSSGARRHNIVSMCTTFGITAEVTARQAGHAEPSLHTMNTCDNAHDILLVMSHSLRSSQRSLNCSFCRLHCLQEETLTCTHAHRVVGPHSVIERAHMPMG